MATRICKLAFGDFCLDVANAELSRDGQRIALAPKPFDVLCCLVDSAGQLLTKDDLLDKVWKNLHVSESSLSFAINAIRSALGDDAQAPRYIETVKRRGYRFVAPVTVVAPATTDRTLQVEEQPRPAVEERARWRVGRAEALAVFDDALRQFRVGSRQVVFVTGEPGIGKTTFVEMAMARVYRREVVVLKGCCIELFGTNEAFLPVIEALQELCRGANREAVLDMLREHAPTWLAQMPAFINDGDRAEFQREIFGATRERMLREFCDLLEVLADALPVIVVIEDLQWSDLGTLDLLSRLARRDREAAILIVATYRSHHSTSQGPSIAAVSHDLQMRRCATEIVLEPLSLAEVQRYMALRFPASDTAHRLADAAFSRTRGQPLFMVSLVDYFVGQRAPRALDDEDRPRGEEAVALEGVIPRDLRDMITIQIEHLDEDERQLVEQASAAGVEFSAAMLAGALGRDALDIEQACESLARRAHVLVASGSAEWPDGTVSGRYAFRHALYREVLYQRLTPGQRVRVHRLLAEHLEQGYRDHFAEIASVLALHFEEGRQVAKAILYLNLAAMNAGKRFSNRDAESYLTRALALVDRLPRVEQENVRGKILKRRAWIRRVIGNLSGCMDDLNAMVASIEAVGPLRSEVTALIDLSRFCFYADRPRCRQISQRAVARSEGLDDANLKAAARGNDATLRVILTGWDPVYADICFDAIGRIRDAGDPQLAMCGCEIESRIKYMMSDYEGCMAVARRGTQLARVIGDAYIFVLFHSLEAFSRLHMGAWGDMKRGLASALALAERNANRQASALCHLSSAWLQAESLDFAGARACCDRVLDARTEADPFNFFIGKNLLLKACVGLGDHAAARACLDQITRKVEVEGIQMEAYIRPHYHHSASQLWLAVGDLDAAQAEAEKLGAWTSRAPERTFWSLAHRLFAKIAMAKGDMEGALAQLSTAMAILENNELPLAAWRVYATAAHVYERLGKAEEAARYVNRSRAVIDALAGTLETSDPLRASLRSSYAIER